MRLLKKPRRVRARRRETCASENTSQAASVGFLRAADCLLEKRGFFDTQSPGGIPPHFSVPTPLRGVSPCGDRESVI